MENKASVGYWSDWKNNTSKNTPESDFSKRLLQMTLLLPLPIYISHSSSAGCLDSRLILWSFPLQLVKITSQYYIYCAENYCPTLFGGDAERSTRIANVMANCFQWFTRVSHIFWWAKFCSYPFIVFRYLAAFFIDFYMRRVSAACASLFPGQSQETMSP